MLPQTPQNALTQTYMSATVTVRAIYFSTTGKHSMFVYIGITTNTRVKIRTIMMSLDKKHFLAPLQSYGITFVYAVCYVVHDWVLEKHRQTDYFFCQVFCARQYINYNS